MVRVRAGLVPLALVGMVACAGFALGRIYDGTLLPRLVAGAGAGAVLLSVLARRLPAWTAGPLSVAGLLGYTLLAVRLSAGAADVPGTLAGVTADAARNGIPRLLTALIPVEPQPDTVLVPVVVAWLAGLAGAELAVRGRRVLLGCLPPVLAYAGALYLVGPNAAAATWPTLIFAGLAAVALAASGPGSPTSATADIPRRATTLLQARFATGAALALVVLTGLAVVVGPVVAGRVATTPDDPRRHVTPPQLDALDENPLIRLSGWAVNPEQHLFDATVDSDTRIRLGVLSDFDGVTWRVNATYRSAGRSLPASAETPEGEQAPTETVRQQITIADLAGHLLPAVAAPRRVDGVRVAFDTAAGTLARPEGITSGLRYDVVSQRPAPDVNLLPAAEVPSGPAVAHLLHLGAGPPAELERLARQITEGGGAPYQRAAAIEAFLGEHYRFTPDAPSGHGYPNLEFFLLAPREAGGQRGTSEQFAAAFAVLARIVGLPSRVVVGFQVRAGTPTVTAADALAWPEVLFTDLGWVPFQPLPDPGVDARPIEEEFRPQPETSEPPPSPVPTIELSVPPLTPAPDVAAPAQPGGGSTAAVLAVISGGLVVLGAIGFAVAVPLLRRALRRRRLDRGPPPERVAGAWLELSDALRLAGRRAAPHLAATEVVEHATAAAGLPRSAHRHTGARLPAPPLDDLAAAVNASVFGPTPAGEPDAERARAQAVAYVDELRSRRGPLRRLLWILHPGPLRWHRR